MLKQCLLIALLIVCLNHTKAQCLIAPAPPACLGSEPLLVENDVLNQGTTKWFYGSATTLNTITMRGGTMVVSGDLTIDKFYMDSGAIYVHPGAKLIIASGIGAGLVLRGNSAIYNYGQFEIQRNLSLDNGWASASKPNIVVNATATSVFRMPNQYFVINNPYSWFVNNGSAEFWGIITDQQSVPGSVCLGNGSSTRMAILINKIANSYIVPTGTACLNVYQWSQFFNRLTNSTGLLACLGPSHTSDAGCIPFGCQPNNWGSAQVFTNCGGCSAVVALEGGFTSFFANVSNHVNHLQWQLTTEYQDCRFRIERSPDGLHFQTIDSLPVTQEQTIFSINDKNPLPGNNYYMIKFINPRTNRPINSKIINVYREQSNGFSFYPMPFGEKLFISYSPGQHPEKIIVTDILGRNIRTRHTTNENTQQVELHLLETLAPGLYIVHLKTNQQIVSKTVIRQ